MGMNMSWLLEMRFLKALPFLLSSVFLIHCARSPIKTPSEALRVDRTPGNVQDYLGKLSFMKDLQSHITNLKKIRSTKKMEFGPYTVQAGKYLSELKKLLKDLKAIKSNGIEKGSHWEDAVKSRFLFMEIYGDGEWGEAFITGYYNPVVQGSLRRTKRFSRPLYGVPNDLVYVDLKAFGKELLKYQPTLAVASEKKTHRPLLRGRLTEKNKAGERKIVPYYDREEIDGKGRLEGKRLELIWLDPIEAFFLEIQGSGVVDIGAHRKKGRYRTFGYAAQNGYPYVAIGKFLLDKIPLKEMSMQSLKDHLRSLSGKEAQKILNKNPSHVFFNKVEGLPKTYMGTSVIVERTIATDTEFFPKGALGYLAFKKPVWDGDVLLEEKEWPLASRFVFDQDTGGAIRGSHRVDLYWGFGAKAARTAGVMRHKGTLHYLFPKDALPEEALSK